MKNASKVKIFSGWVTGCLHPLSWEGCRCALVPSGASNTPSPRPLPRRLAPRTAHAFCGEGGWRLRREGVGAGREDGKCKISSLRSFFMLCPPIAQKLGLFSDSVNSAANLEFLKCTFRFSLRPLRSLR